MVRPRKRLLSPPTSSKIKMSLPRAKQQPALKFPVKLVSQAAKSLGNNLAR